MAANIGRQARALHHQASQYAELLHNERGYEKTQAALQTLLDALGQDFDLAAEGYHASQRAGKQGTSKAGRLFTKGQLARKVRHLSTSRASIMKQQKEFIAGRFAGRINVMWAVRVGLADPNTSSESVEAWVTEFPPNETKNVSGGSVPRRRDCWVELVKYQNRQIATSWGAQNSLGG